MDELLEQKRELPKKRMWNKFFGKVKFSDSPVQYQRNLRDE